ncbi:MAG: anthranilate phosphoribosyltransferase, partial [Gemmatimonadales bacterium]|nr:anthranilate phosphoribosyltransferase [Gemmatimonadales bacterium]
MTNTIRRVLSGETLDAAAAEATFDRFMSGEATQAEMAALLAALRMRGETAAEVAGGVRALRKAMIPLALDDDRIIDTCGTGGGTLTTFNISTAAAIVAAAGAVRIAKHGNRSFTSKCGSADVLEILGVSIELPPEDEK